VKTTPTQSQPIWDAVRTGSRARGDGLTRVGALGALALAGWLTGCASVENVTVNMVNVQFTSATLFESSAVFTLRVNNENPRPLLLEGSSHKIYLNGTYVGQGLNGDTTEVPRFGSAPIRAEVHLSHLALATRLRPMVESGVFSYELRNVLHFKQPSCKVRVVSQGQWDAQDFQPAPR
jgi:LEA14-like dessication related protein